MQVALVNPQIPQNTGSIARTCAATKTRLNIVGDIPFEITEKRVRRAGLDYWPWVDLHRYPDWESFSATVATEQIWLFSKFGTRAYWDASFGKDAILVFGSETKGLGASFLANYPKERVLSIPMIEPQVRSLNLSNAVSIGVYEAYRQLTRKAG